MEPAGKFTANLYVTQTVDVPNRPGNRGVDKKEDREVTRIIIQADSLEELKTKLGKHIEII